MSPAMYRDLPAPAWRRLRHSGDRRRGCDCSRRGDESDDRRGGKPGSLLTVRVQLAGWLVGCGFMVDGLAVG